MAGEERCEVCQKRYALVTLQGKRVCFPCFDDELRYIAARNRWLMRQLRQTDRRMLVRTQREERWSVT